MQTRRLIVDHAGHHFFAHFAPLLQRPSLLPFALLQHISHPNTTSKPPSKPAVAQRRSGLIRLCIGYI